jgi:uncharacterized repeat protein (TIGR02543 family)
MKKIFTLFAALAMVLSMFAANIPAGTKFYLTPSANWNQSNARFAVYFYGNGEAWVSMTKVAGETNLYEVTSPNKSFTNVIFCRMNPSASANNWNNKWNQTADLTYDGTKNHYTVKEGTWDKGGGTWSVWPIPAEVTYTDVTITVTANAAASIIWKNAGDKLADATDYVAMTAGENNTYSYTLAQVDEIKGVTYTIKVGEIKSIEQTTDKSVSVDFKDILPQVAVMGVNNWDGTDKMTISDDYLSASITLPLTVKAYEWKITVNGEWFGGNKYAITRDKNSLAVTDNVDGNGKLTADVAGDYVFTYTYANKTLVVTYPVAEGDTIEPTPAVISYVLMGVKGDWTTGIALTANPDNANEYMLLGQEILAGDAVKVVTLTDGVATAWCGNVDEYSVAREFDKDGNIILAPGKYDFYYKVAEEIIYIGGEAYPVENKTITWELNGGELPAVVVPTNAELWEAFKPYYNKYYTANGKLVKDRADQPIDKVSTFAAAYMQEIMTDEKSEYKWLGDYVLGVAAGQGVTLPTDMASANEGAWRWAVHAFFNATAGANGAAGTDFTEAGKPEAWGSAYQAAYGVVLPTEAVEADYTLPTPVKTGFTFVGWYDNAEGEGDAMTVLKAGWSGTIYAIWKQDSTTGVENTVVAKQVVKIVRNGQVLIMVGDKTFNMMGQEVK